MFASWPSIGSLHNVVRTYEVYPHVAPEPVRYRAKIKLHGVNAGVFVGRERILAQGRNTLLSVGNDPEGFARWVESPEVQEYFRAISVADQPFTIFGEWAGPGVQRGVALSSLPEKIFAVFAIMLHDKNVPDLEQRLIVEPATIHTYLPYLHPGIYVLPWETEESTLDFSDRPGLDSFAQEASEVVHHVENVDPWVKREFGVEGTGEGLVYFPDHHRDTVTVKRFSDLAFKAKGEKHKVVKMRTNVAVDPEVAQSIEEFTEMFVTPARLQQGVREGAKGQLDMRQIGPFLAWFCEDVRKESKDELDDSGLEWKHVVKSVQTAARVWYKDQVDQESEGDHVRS